MILNPKNVVEGCSIFVLYFDWYYLYLIIYHSGFYVYVLINVFDLDYDTQTTSANESCEDLQGRTFTGGNQTPGYNCRYSYLKHLFTSVLSCKHVKGSVVGSRTSMLRSDSGDVSHCTYQEEFCMTGEGQAISWQSESEEKTEYLVVRNFSAIMISENHLMTDQVGLAFDLREMSQIDARTFQDKEFRVIFGRKFSEEEAWEMMP